MKVKIMLALLVWFAFGFITGMMETLSERTDFKNPRTGCVYESYATFLMPGRIAACELFRKRFEYEGLE